MNILKSSLAATLLLSVVSLTQAAVIVSVEDEGVLKSTVSNATTIDFEGLGVLFPDLTQNCPLEYVSCAGDYQVRESNGNVNQSAAPFMATAVGESFLTVPNPLSNGSATFTLDGDYNYFGLFWGSVDTYNTIEFLNDGVLQASVNGGNIDSLLANGSQASWRSNRFVNFNFSNGMEFDSVRLVSTSFAFETDNHAFARVSAPSVVGLLGLGILAMGALGRFKK
ncbi:hypothetical protein KJ365_06795 [Glaciecola sp. XM2]|jgi:hypothetical protein|uniref:Npun_F0296 family exosortase-dependent surface protein n=1 Tax=Glaciecola sp. XM2 TaxID=1914931 RepID=UPI001BDDF4B0|nr:hypothetical protein [Glaciecola sp. XM2]MBT1450586.1 hypothetical protein [Glaciecola sp. XM2]